MAQEKQRLPRSFLRTPNQKDTKGHIVLGCASTGLACQVYDEGEFVTAHSMLAIPVFDDIDQYDDDATAFSSNLIKHPHKLELIQSARVIIWDEFLRYGF